MAVRVLPLKITVADNEGVTLFTFDSTHEQTDSTFPSSDVIMEVEKALREAAAFLVGSDRELTPKKMKEAGIEAP